MRKWELNFIIGDWSSIGGVIEQIHIGILGPFHKKSGSVPDTPGRLATMSPPTYFYLSLLEAGHDQQVDHGLVHVATLLEETVCLQDLCSISHA